MIEILLNGEVRSTGEGQNLSALLDELSLPDQRIAVELNGNVVARSEWANTRIVDGDRLEVVHFVGGG